MAHQRHAAFTPACFALPSGTAPRKRTFHQGRANPHGTATSRTYCRHNVCHTLQAIISHAAANHPAHQRHAAFTPACSETSSKSEAPSLQNERFFRDFLQKVKRQVSKTSVSSETSSKSEARPIQNVLSPAFRALDKHDLRRGLRAPNPKCNLTCMSRPRHARSPQRVARDKSKTQSHLLFAPSTRTISAEGCAGHGKNAISPAFRVLDTHDLPPPPASREKEKKSDRIRRCEMCRCEDVKM